MNTEEEKTLYPGTLETFVPVKNLVFPDDLSRRTDTSSAKKGTTRLDTSVHPCPSVSSLRFTVPSLHRESVPTIGNLLKIFRRKEV